MATHTLAKQIIVVVGHNDYFQNNIIVKSKKDVEKKRLFSRNKKIIIKY